MENINHISSINITDNVFRVLSKTTVFFDEKLRKKFCLDQTEILTETFQRVWESCWTSETRCFDKKSLKKLNEDSILCFKSSKGHSLTKFRKALKKPSRAELLEGKTAEIVEVPYNEKVHDYAVKVSFAFDNVKNEFSVILESLEVRNPNRSESEVLQEIQAEFDKIQKRFERSLKLSKTIKEFNFNLFLEKLFDTMKRRHIVSVDGSDAVHMKDIYPQISESFPDFAKLSHPEKIKVLKSACTKALFADSRRDVYLWAKATFEALVEANLIGTLKRYEPRCGDVLEFAKIGENRKDIYNPDDPTEIWRKNALIFVEYRTTDIKAAFTAFDLWSQLFPKTWGMGMAS